MTTSSIKIDAFCPVGIGGTKGIDTTHLKIFVGGLLPTHTSKDLYDIFSPFGTIRESVVIPDRFRVRSRCYGFVTFKSHSSVSEVFRQSPITTANGAKLTVVLASANTKPRRAHFNVRHGTSGHKPLPMVKEEETGFDEDKSSTPTNSIMIRARNKASSNTKNKYTKKDKKIGIYTDPSLFRTANIQPIAPASFHVKSKKSDRRNGIRGTWPNEDIKKDYHNLKKVSVEETNDYYDGDNYGYNGMKQENKSWKLVAVEQEMDKDSYYSSYDTASEYAEDEFYSVNSRKWTPLSDKRVSTDSLAPSVANSVSNMAVYDGNGKEKDRESQDWRKHDRKSKLTKSSRRRARGRGGSKTRLKWVPSPVKSKPNGDKSDKKPSGSKDTATPGPNKQDNKLNKPLSIGMESEDEDRLTFASLFDDYQNLINSPEGQAMHRNNANMNGAEMDQLRNIFKHKMQQKIVGGNNGHLPQSGPAQSTPMFNNSHQNMHTNGLWSPYKPMFDGCQGSIKSSSNGGSVQGYGQNGQIEYAQGPLTPLLTYNYNTIVPTPPIQPLVPTNSLSDNGSNYGYDVNAGYGFNGLTNYGQANVVCNTNYFYGSNGSLHSVSNHNNMNPNGNNNGKM